MDSELLVAVGDLHAGSSVALMPEEVQLDDGQTARPSREQRWLLDLWYRFWTQAARERERTGARLWVLLLGDLVEGLHHRNEALVSTSLADHRAILRRLLELPLSLGPTGIFVVRGTGTHSGAASSEEEHVARWLSDAGYPVQRDSAGATYSWWHLRAKLAGVRIDAAHHTFGFQREHTRAGAAVRMAAEILQQYARDGEPPPRLVLGAHQHRYSDSGDSTPVRVVIIPGWQLHTPYTRHIGPHSLADIGGAIAHLADGELRSLQVVRWRPQRGAVWEPKQP